MPSSYTDTLLNGHALDDTLSAVAADAARSLDQVDAAAAVVHRGADLVRSSSHPLAARVDAVQYRVGQGPCLYAFHTGWMVLLDLGCSDPRWPVFQAAAVDAGAQTVLSVPLRLDEYVIGSLNLYSRTRGAYSADTIHQAELFARPAALRLTVVGVAVHAAEAAEVAALELQDQATIDRALGVLMGVHRDPSVERARRRLEQAGTALRLDVLTAAADIVRSPLSRGT